MESIIYDLRFFQRGRTWSECLESWDHQREVFLRRVNHAQALQGTYRKLRAQPAGDRLAVFFNPCHIDCFLALPYLGATLAKVSHLECRFFDSRIFFSRLHGLGRKMPLIQILDETGIIKKYWGPRPEGLNLEWQQQQGSGQEKDAWLLAYNRVAYVNQLDQSLVEFF